MLPWLWHSPALAALIQPLAWDLHMSHVQPKKEREGGTEERERGREGRKGEVGTVEVSKEERQKGP